MICFNWIGELGWIIDNDYFFLGGSGNKTYVRNRCNDRLIELPL